MIERKMMRKRIDAHVHIFRDHLPGTFDPYVGTTFEEYGAMSFEDGKRIQKMPVYMKNSCFDAETLMHLLDAQQIEKALIMQSGSPFFMDETVRAVKEYPGRLFGAMVLDLGDAGCLDQMKCYVEKGLKIIKFDMHDDMGMLCPRRFPKMKFDDEIIIKIMGQAEKMGLTVTIDPGAITGDGYQVERLRILVSMFPNLRFVFCHLGFPPVYGDKKRWRAFMEMGRKANVWFDIAALPEIIGTEAYPYPMAARLVRDVMDLFGKNKVIWGSDIPGTLNLSTYQQMIDIYEKSRLFSEQEKDCLFYENAMQAYF